MSVNKREMKRERWRQKFQGPDQSCFLPLNCMRRMFFSSSDCTYCMFITISDRVSGMCISECFSLHVDQSLTKTNKKKNLNECVSWMCFTIVTGPVFQYTHRRVSPWCVCFWYSATLSSNVLLCLLNVLWSTASCPLFGDLKFQCCRQIGSKLWPGWQIFRSLWDVYNSAKPHCEAQKKKAIVRPQSVTSQCFSQPFLHLSHTRLHQPSLSSLETSLNMLILINAWSH